MTHDLEKALRTARRNADNGPEAEQAVIAAKKDCIKEANRIHKTGGPKTEQERSLCQSFCTVYNYQRDFSQNYGM